MKKYICLFLFYTIANHLPNSYLPIVGKFSNYIRIFLCKQIFAKCGKVSIINRNVYFGKGFDIEIGDYSGIGENARIPPNTIIGKYVMIAPDLYIIASNHHFHRTDIPMCFQGGEENSKPIIIEDDVWIGGRVTITPNNIIKKGSVIAAGAVVTKDVEEYSIVAGVPAKTIKKRVAN